MTNATKTLAIVFAGSVALALAASWSWSSSSSAAFQDELLSVDTSAVQAVRIERGTAPSIRLERAANGWSVAPSDASTSYPASPQAIRDLFDTLPTLQVEAVTTRQTEKHARYGVDSTGTTLTMLGADDEPLGKLVVGRTQMQQVQQQGPRQNPMRRAQPGGTPITYVRTPDRPDVYSVEQPLESVVRRDVEDWRARQLWTVDRSDIQRVDFRFPADSSFTMQRAASPDSVSTAAPDTWLSDGDTLETTAVSSVLQVLSAPEADGFVDDTDPNDFGEARYTVRLQTTDDARHTLKVRPGSDDEHYVGVADDFPYVVQLRKNRWDRAVLQGRSSLLKEE